MRRRAYAAAGAAALAAGVLGAPAGPAPAAARARAPRAEGDARGGGGVVEEVTPQPTALTASLQAEGAGGTSIEVPAQTPVSAVATLDGANAAGARGSISWKVYSDPACTEEVAWSGPRSVREGVPSRAIRLPAGTYYWQAGYSGDALNLPSQSACGATVETVEGGADPSCASVRGHIEVSTAAGPLAIHEDLSTDAALRQRLTASWGRGQRLRMTRLLDAACAVKARAATFTAVGEAALDGAPGFRVRVWVSVSPDGEDKVRVHVHNARGERVLDLATGPAAGSEAIA